MSKDDKGNNMLLDPNEEIKQSLDEIMVKIDSSNCMHAKQSVDEIMVKINSSNCMHVRCL
jgi:hypothetical protein